MLHQANECENLASEGYKPSFSEQETNRINNVYIYVMQNFSEEVSLGVAAELVNMTPNAFCRFQTPYSKIIFQICQ